MHRHSSIVFCNSQNKNEQHPCDKIYINLNHFQEDFLIYRKIYVNDKMQHIKLTA